MSSSKKVGEDEATPREGEGKRCAVFLSGRVSKKIFRHFFRRKKKCGGPSLQEALVAGRRKKRASSHGLWVGEGVSV